MSAYILVEGRRTEPKIYPSWLRFFKPEYSRVSAPSEVNENKYFLVSGYGYPNIINQIESSLEDIFENPDIENLIIIVDREEEEEEDLRNFIFEKVNEAREKIGIDDIQVQLIIQVRSIETWLLGNKAIFKRNPTDIKLGEYLNYYRVDNMNPELMGKHTFNTHAQFHSDYLKRIFNERNIKYSKKNPGDARKEFYFNELVHRTEANSEDLKSFQDMLEVFSSI